MLPYTNGFSLGPYEIELLQKAFARPYDWILAPSKIPLEGQTFYDLHHQQGFKLRVQRRASSALILDAYLPKSFVGFEPPKRYIDNGIDCYIAISDPEPRWGPAEKIVFFTLRIERFDTEDIGRAFDEQLGQTAWARIRALMWASAHVWNAHGLQWHCTPSLQEEYLLDDSMTHTEVFMHQRIYPVLQDQALSILQDTVFQPITAYTLPSKSHSGHERLHMIKTLHSMNHLPAWLQRF